ncbi:DsbA family protein [Aerococcus sanguinicola]|uniref:DsbA family protein n=1 Tax=Aerococcus sanguinicola TaxID=119206 RepID=UPI0018A7BFB5|nr:DsbA family protein [Aerococcus sanguinicola]
MKQFQYSHKQTTDLTAEDHDHVFELFLFVNPMGSNCHSCEEEVLDFMEHTDKRVYYRFIACNDFRLFNEYLKQKNWTKLSLGERNRLYCHMHQIAVGYKAALLQGKKVGRQFLMTMQEHFGLAEEEFTKERMLELAKEARVDLEMWQEDIDSGSALKSYHTDLKIAQQMKIRSNPSLVIFDNLDFRYSLKLDQDITKDNLDYITDQMIHPTEDSLFNYQASHYHNKANKSQVSTINTGNLRLLNK